MTPFLKVSNVGELARVLPQATQEKDNEIRVLMPRFGCINERRNRLHEVIRLSGMNIVVDENDNPLIIKVASLPSARLQVYFLDNEDYFQRKFVFRDSNEKFYDDNDERAIFFCKGAIETVKKLGWSPDVVHCHDWMTSFVPLYLKTTYKDDPVFKNAKVVYSVYKNGFEENISERFAAKTYGAGVSQVHLDSFKEKNTCSGLHNLAIHYSDAVVKNSEDIHADVSDFIITAGKHAFDYEHAKDINNFSSIYEEILSENLITI